MADLFSDTPPLEPRPGVSNAEFLGHLANGILSGQSIETIAGQLRERWKRGEMRGLNQAIARDNLNFWKGA